MEGDSTVMRAGGSVLRKRSHLRRPSRDMFFWQPQVLRRLRDTLDALRHRSEAVQVLRFRP